MRSGDLASSVASNPTPPRAPAWVLVLVLLAAALAGCANGPQPVPGNQTDDGTNTTDPPNDPTDPGLPIDDVPTASGERLMTMVHRQVFEDDANQTHRYRIPGTQGHEAAVGILEGMLEDANLTVETERFQAELPKLGTVNVTNLYGVREGADPDAGEIWLAAHWDSRAWADATGPSCEGPPVLGANDGAAAVAVVLHAIERLPETNRTIRAALFDAEDQGCQGEGWITGSTHAARVRQEDGRLDALDALILVDMPGATPLTIPREGNSAVRAPNLTDLVFDVADDLDASSFRNEGGPGITDDHVPFLERGVPAVDLIHLDSNGTSPFPWMWHTTEDTPEHLSEASMAEVTRVVMGTTLAIDRGAYAGESGSR